MRERCVFVTEKPHRERTIVQPPMTWILHLSDLHLLENPAEQQAIFRSLINTLAAERQRRGSSASLLCITGDVFRSATVERHRAIDLFSTLLEGMHRALGGQVPTVIIPGNHDRRRSGVFLPHDCSLFDALRDRLEGRAWVHGAASPTLAELVPHEIHGLPLWIVAYDSNHLPGGVIGAGGALYQEDLLRIASLIDGDEPDWPILFLLHHHLVPTPITDLGAVDVSSASRPLRWIVERGLPRIVASGDREELFMTALGAGTALSTLHTMGRPVLVLHGHKHYATTRLIKATRPEQGDLLIVSAGSAGRAERWRASNEIGSARLWPSFNTIELDERGVRIEQLAYHWRASDTKAEIARRPMVEVQREGKGWRPGGGIDGNAIDPGPQLLLNDARYLLSRPSRGTPGRYDMRVGRRVHFAPQDAGETYAETVGGPSGSRLIVEKAVIRLDGGTGLPGELELNPRGASYYRIHGALPITLSEHLRMVGRDARPYARVELMNRYHCEHARLTVKGLGRRAKTAFGSVTDLGTGLERPVSVEADWTEERVSISIRDCPPRTPLRIYWLLDDRQELDVEAGPQKKGEQPVEPPLPRLPRELPAAPGWAALARR